MSKIESLYRYIEEGYVFSNIDEILELEFTKMLKTNIKIKKCKRCAKYFRLKGNYNADYCSRISEGETRNCQDIAAAEKYKEKLANNKALQIYNKYYKRYHSRLKVKQIKEPDFYSWKYKTLIMRVECEDGNVTPEEYEAWNEEYFPNRTKK
jgi:predicted amidophosphoribosyltransferase